MSMLENKTAIVTGAARGMGAAHVRRMVSEGARVFFTDVLQEEGDALAAELGSKVAFAPADVASESDWNRVVAATETLFGAVDILVNNAGLLVRSPLLEMSEIDYRRVIDVNQIGVFLGMKAVIPSMRRAGGGSIINISSISGMVGIPQSVAYTSSKFAVRGMTKVAALEFGADNIRVNSVHPGFILTPMTAHLARSGSGSPTAKVPLGRMGVPEDVSDMVVFLACDRSSYCSGSEFVIDGGLLAG